ncbi:reverse transcriptase-like protein [Alkalicoccus daliensis]|uniref:Ribonuclease HI n=1 Tax=Alkalicoccus daliensis TaxID=745820 RepID=A0A1H0EQ32_9BACI|nr:reverse transcriptase-like protein [Alkalicoccus daliensis]SDN84514.1 ribonuclease HI [Alkalicoccus daliensis]
MKGRLEMNYFPLKGSKIKLYSEEMEMEEAHKAAEDLLNTGRTKEIVFIDQRESGWNMKEMQKYLTEIEEEPHNVTIYFDGGFDRNSTEAGVGAVIYYEQNGKHYRVRKNSLVENLLTNNEAEYAALYFALQELEPLGVHHLPVEIKGDSQVVINQLSGEWPVMEKTLNEWVDKIEEKLKETGITPEYCLIVRKKNQEADQLASQAIQKIEISSKKEI